MKHPKVKTEQVEMAGEVNQFDKLLLHIIEFIIVVLVFYGACAV